MHREYYVICRLEETGAEQNQCYVFNLGSCMKIAEWRN